jgi:hypothetical protein
MKKARRWSTGPAVQKSSATAPCGGSAKFLNYPIRRFSKIPHLPPLAVQQNSSNTPSGGSAKFRNYPLRRFIKVP